MDKKGSFQITFEELFIFPRVILLTIAIVGIMTVIFMFVNREIETQEVTSFLFSNILLSDECFGADNQYGVIDKSKFNEDILNRCVKCDTGFLSAKISLGDEEIEFNDFNTREILCSRSGKCSLQSIFVLVDENNALRPDTMYVEVLLNE